MTKTTSWGHVAPWYHEMLEAEGTYQKDVILPNLLRLLNIQKGQKILDLACGTGFFSRAFAQEGAQVVGSDIAKELIAIAKHNSSKNIEYIVSPAHNISFLKNESVDNITLVLAIQNIENVNEVLKECGRVLKKEGRLMVVLNHPAFRVPKQSEWGWDEEKKTQYRRIDAYLSEAKVQIEMHPGDNPEQKTVSFHRSLQYYFKAFSKAGLAVTRLEEWISHRQGPKGRKYAASEKARKEIPIFLFLELAKLKQ